ncbi:MAG: sigma-70 family RNA polymerase sigma factor [Bdellovibrionota bacterium]
MLRIKTRPRPSEKKEEGRKDFPTFYRAYERLVRSTLYHLIGKNDLDDLTQQVFVRCWQKYSQFEGRSEESTWVIKIAINLAKDHWRKTKNHLQMAAEEQALNLIDDRSLESRASFENQQALEKALNLLSFEHRSVIVLMYFQDLSLEEIGELTDESLGTVKSRLHYARAELRRLLLKMGIEV